MAIKTVNDTFKKLLNQIATDEKLHLSSLYILSRMDQTSLEIFREVWPAVPIQRRRSIMGNLVEISEGQTIRANVALLANNGRTAGQIAQAVQAAES